MTEHLKNLLMSKEKEINFKMACNCHRFNKL